MFLKIVYEFRHQKATLSRDSTTMLCPSAFPPLYNTTTMMILRGGAPLRELRLASKSQQTPVNAPPVLDGAQIAALKGKIIIGQ